MFDANGKGWIVLADHGYDGLGLPGEEPLPVFPSEDAAITYAKKHRLISPRGVRNDAAIIEVTQSFYCGDCEGDGCSTCNETGFSHE